MLPGAAARGVWSPKKLRGVLQARSQAAVAAPSTMGICCSAGAESDPRAGARSGVFAAEPTFFCRANEPTTFVSDFKAGSAR